MIVIDASSLAKYILREENWEEVRRFLASGTCSLTLALAEVANDIWKHYAVYSSISSREAKIMFRALKETREVVVYEALEDYLSRAQEIAMKENITIYDSLYIAQAEKYKGLLTSDKKQRKVAEKMNINVKFVE